MEGFDFRGNEPIYVQLKEKLRGYITSGAIAENERLPSVREIATSLSVNPNTVQRAYRELEDEGYIKTVAGKGSFALKNDGTLRRIAELMEELAATAGKLRELGVSDAELIDFIKK